MRSFIGILFIGALLFGLTSCSGSGGLVVNDAWARPASAGGISAVYLVIDNTGGKADNLLGAISPVAEGLELHQTSIASDGTMSMQPQASVPVPAGELVTFEPGGLHIMVINLRQDLLVGDSFPLALNFENAGEITLSVPVNQP